jgi:hypothetical protein
MWCPLEWTMQQEMVYVAETNVFLDKSRVFGVEPGCRRVAGSMEGP